jgi:hypothetical protein
MKKTIGKLPNYLQEKVDEIYWDGLEQQWWVELKDEWLANIEDGCHCFGEPTKKAVIEMLKDSTQYGTADDWHKFRCGVITNDELSQKIGLLGNW